MEVICIETEAFFKLFEEVITHLEQKKQKTKFNKWISKKEAMTSLGIKSASTLQKLRDLGKIKFSQPMKRVIVYDRNSIDQLLEKNSIDLS